MSGKLSFEIRQLFWRNHEDFGPKFCKFSLDFWITVGKNLLLSRKCRKHFDSIPEEPSGNYRQILIEFFGKCILSGSPGK